MDSIDKLIKNAEKSIELERTFFGAGIEDWDIYELELKILKRAKPLKPEYDEELHYFSCPKCGNPVRHAYCAYCGQKLDWKGERDEWERLKTGI